MKKIFFVMMLFFFCISSQGTIRNVREEKINALLDENKYEEALTTLESWKADKGEEDPQYWVAGGNIWFGIAATPTLEVSSLPNGAYGIKITSDKKLLITDPKTGKSVGEISEGKPRIKEKEMKQAIAFLDEGIRRNPHRLDIFIGRAHLYRAMSDWKGELTALESFVKDPKPLDGKYQNGSGKFLSENLVEFQLDMLMAYAREHLEKQDKANDDAAKEIAELLMRLFPKHPHGYNLVGVLATYNNNWIDAKNWFQLALEQDREDSLVLSNLGRCYENLNDIKSAKEQYERIIKLNNNPELIKNAKSRIAAFEKKEPDQKKL